MARIASLLLLGVGLVVCAAARADGPEESGIKNALALQGAMEQARHFLYRGNDAKKAVEILEEHLPRVDGNATFLRLLRDAYRAYIKDLYLANQAAAARRYFERLCVLDPAAANDPTLRPSTAEHKLLPPPAPKDEKTSILPNFARNLPFLGGGDKAPAGPAKAPTVRAKNDGALEQDDPFDQKHRRAAQPEADKGQLALQLVAKAEDEFKRKRYIEARAFYEQAYRVEPKSVADCHERWAYCVLSQTVEQLNQAGGPVQSLADLKKQVNGAVEMAPNLSGTGHWLLAQIEQRQKIAPPAADAPAKHPVQHLGRNIEGWLVTETAHFRIFHKRTDDFGERIAHITEQTRAEMGKKWLGAEPTWPAKCEVIMHPTGSDYTQMTGQSAASPGHARIDTDPSNPGRVLLRRMDMRVDAAGMLEAVLPHETTHVVLAGHFGPYAVPRWVDEGVAVLTEPTEKLVQHRRNLLRCCQENQLFTLRELMQLDNYPEPRRIGAFYAQSVALVEFLTSQKGPLVFTNFVRDALREGYDPSLRRHYGWDFNQLEAAWQQQVLGGANVAATKASRQRD